MQFVELTKNKNPLKDITVENISAGFLASIFGCVATTFIIINAGTQVGLSDAQIISWVFAAWFFGGVLGLVISFITKQPISGAWSIPAAVLLGGTLKSFTMEQAVGAYFLAGVLVFLLGASGLINRVTKFIPMPIIMAMICGALMRFATGIFTSMESLPLIAGGTVLAYFLAGKVIKKITPVFPALVVGCILTFLTGAGSISAMQTEFMGPIFYMPEFSLSAFIAISIPVAILVVGAENAQAIGVLMSEGYNPPVKTMTVFSGIGGMVACFFGGHNANIAGPMTAICSSDAAGPDKSKRYVASMINGILCLTFGALVCYAISFIKLVPTALVSTIAGLAMINVLLQSLQQAFNPGARFQVGAFIAFAIALSGVNLWNISAPFWSLVGGVLVTVLTDMDSFRSLLGKTSQAKGQAENDAVLSAGAS